MDTTLVVALLSGLFVVVGALITAVVGPVIYPWYGERMSKAQLRVQRRMQVREMIENELLKGFHDLASVGGYLTLLIVEPAAAAQPKASQRFIDNEFKFGPWLGYAVSNTDIKELCEEYRDIIRGVRMMVGKRDLPRQQGDAQLAKGRESSNKKAAQIVAKMNELGW
ncbi:MAG: hypothetical protein IIC90_04515 [Chloroflexi bacterium]|nr:hypothetical protein [Chloroflexota bacterium]